MEHIHSTSFLPSTKAWPRQWTSKVLSVHWHFQKDFCSRNEAKRHSAWRIEMTRPAVKASGPINISLSAGRGRNSIALLAMLATAGQESVSVSHFISCDLLRPADNCAPRKSVHSHTQQPPWSMCLVKFRPESFPFNTRTFR